MKKKPVSAVEPALSSGLRRYLYFTAAITGAVIMIVEILGAKMLSPYLGTSHFVWTAQIGVTLLALACGYYAGGRLVDRSSRLSVLYGAILAAAVYLVLTVALVEWAAYQFLELNLAAGSLLASAFLFFIPLSLLAMVGPFLIRVITSSVNDVGGNVGRLTAISTVGSALGTASIGYVLIPFLPNSITMYGTALLLIGLAAGYGIGWGRKTGINTGLALAVAAALGLGYAGWEKRGPDSAEMREVYRGNSNFGLLQVFEARDNPHRMYLNDYLTQNTYDYEEKKSYSMFTYMLHGLAHAYTPRIEDVLCIGLGIGIVPMEFAREGARVDVVEINPAVVPLAQKYFDLEPERLNIFLGDGRYFLNRCERQYDTVVLDAFLGDSSPSHLMTREAFSAIRRVLKPDGTLVINTFADLSPGRDFFAASLFKTLASVFASVRIHNEGNGNTLFVASSRPNLAIVNQPDFERVHRFCVGQVRRAFAGVRATHPEHGRVLTDDYNPVEFYDAGNRERLRRNLAFYMRR